MHEQYNPQSTRENEAKAYVVAHEVLDRAPDIFDDIAHYKEGRNLSLMSAADAVAEVADGMTDRSRAELERRAKQQIGRACIFATKEAYSRERVISLIDRFCDGYDRAQMII